MITKLWDLNVWFKDLGHDDEDVNQWDDVISINPAIYIREGDGSIYDNVTKIYTGIVYRCTPIETTKIRAFRSEQEYGTDWFDFADEFYALEISKSINDFIDALGDPSLVDTSDNGDLYHIDTLEKLGGLRVLPANGG